MIAPTVAVYIYGFGIRVGVGGTAYAQTLLSLRDISPMRGIPTTTRAKFNV